MAAALTDIEDIYPLTPTQQGMLFHDLLVRDAGLQQGGGSRPGEGSGVYVVQVAFTLSGLLDLDAFAQAWRTLQARHGVLRTACAWEGLPQPVQVIGRDAPFEIDVIDLARVDASTRRRALEDWLSADRARGFDPRHAPLMRVTMFRLGDDQVRVVWTYHHLLLDGWSLPLLLEEWVSCYLAARRGQAPALPPAFPYRDFVEWLSTGDREAAQSFWRPRLTDFTEPNRLTDPWARARSAGTTPGRCSVRLTSNTSAHLGAFARAHRLTVSCVVQGAWALLASRLSGDDDIVYGLARSGRPPSLPGFDQRVGLFLNLLPMRTRIDADQTVVDWLTSMQEELLAQQPFEHAALRDVHEVSAVGAGKALFESIVVFENYPAALAREIDDGRLTISDVDVDEQTNYPLNLYCTQSETLELRLLHDRGLIAPEQAQALLEYLEFILASLVGEPTARLGELPTLAATRWHRDHVLPNRTRSSTAMPGVIDAIEKAVSRQPTATAVVGPAGSLSYAEVDAQSRRLAKHLADAGISPGSVVAVCLDRDETIPVSLLAVLRRGCAYLPLDPEYPAGRLASAMTDAGAAAVIVDAVSRERLPPSGARVIDLDRERDAIDRASPSPSVDHAAQPGDLAYLIYTSGSTGRPKGVRVTRGNLDNLLAAMADRVGFGNDNRLLAVTTLAFDIATLEMLLPLVCGGRLVIADASQARNAEELTRLLDEHEVDTLQATPSTWRLLLASGWRGRPGLRALCGGEALDIGLARELLTRTAALWNVYGPTETTIWSSAVRVRAEHLNGHGVPIGGPLANTVLHTVDRQGRPLPVGCPGELAIGGSGVSEGYHSAAGDPSGERARLTAERFVDNALPRAAELPAAPRLYRTGDRVRQRPDGLFDFLGRMDTQIKLRGLRIELGEIEAALGDHPVVARAVAEVVDAGSERARLVVVFTTNGNPDAVDGEDAMAAELRAHLATRLPARMLPTIFRRVEALPTTINGKLDRAAVRRLARRGESRGAHPRTPLERTLAGIWQEVLDRAHVGPDDNFFEVGGHSLLLIRAQELIRDRLGLEPALIDLFRHPTPATLAAHLAAPERSGPVDADASDARRRRRAAGHARLASQRQRRHGDR